MAYEYEDVRVPKRILNTLLASLSAGVVPRIGAPYIAIGRQDEINSLLDSLNEARAGGAFCRFLIGKYGSGKSFLIQLIRGYALENNFVCADADLTPERRLVGSSGSGLATYRELMINLSTKASPDGNALTTVLSRHLETLKNELVGEGIMPDNPIFESELKSRVYQVLYELEAEVGGFDFARVLAEYYMASISDDGERKSAALKWIRGEYATKTEAKAALGFPVSTVIDDDNWYSFLKLISSLAVRLGYSGLIVFIDECVNLYKIPNRISREANYEKLLSVFNDTLQGKARNFGVIFGGTPQFLEDTRRGLFSYEALKSRLADSAYLGAGYRSLEAPVIRLRTLSPSELLALVKRLNRLFMQKHGLSTPVIDEGQSLEFINKALSRAGAAELITPREVIRDYLTVLSILKDNQNVSFEELLEKNTNTAEPQRDSISEKEIKKINIFDIDI